VELKVAGTDRRYFNSISASNPRNRGQPDGATFSGDRIDKSAKIPSYGLTSSSNMLVKSAQRIFENSNRFRQQEIAVM